MGFDLDLTLADTRRGIAATYDRLSERLGVFIDSAVAVSRLGPPLESELAHWLPPEEIPAAAALFRSMYPEIAVPATTAMRGAAGAVDAVRRAGGGVIVVTGKHPDLARRTLDHLGIEVDEVAGMVFGAAKGAALTEFGAQAYVGDHIADIEAARAAGAVSVAVATGPYTADELRDHGADVVLPDLTAFVAWHEEWRVSETGTVSTVT